MRRMTMALLLPVGSAFAAGLPGCGSGLRETPEVAITQTVGPKGGVVRLGPARVEISPGSLNQVTNVRLRLIDFDGSGAEGPVFEVRTGVPFTDKAQVEYYLRVDASVVDAGTRGLRFAYRDDASWVGFNTNDSGYRPEQGELWGRVLRFSEKDFQSVIIGPARACGGNSDCESNKCDNGGVCQ